MKSDAPAAFYVARGLDDDGRQHFTSTSWTAGPWTAVAQHGGPPAALLGRAVEGLEPDLGRVVGRIAVDLLGPVPVGPLSVAARVLRPGRTVSLREATLYDDTAGRPVATARAWAFPQSAGTGPTEPSPLPHGPGDGQDQPPPASWARGYFDAIEWRWIEGAVTRPGPGQVWMRPRVPLVLDEPMSPLQRLLTCADSGSGVSAMLDPDRWNFLNTELTVHALRPVAGDWVCLVARTVLGPGAVGLAGADLYDAEGLVGRSVQSLLVSPR